MLMLRWILPVIIVFPTPYNLIGIVILSLGTYILLNANGKFERANTNIKTFDQPGQFVRDGIYRYSRNPMYLGFTTMLMGVWIMLGALSPLIGVLLFTIATDRWYIAFEEKAMTEKFGQDYLAYQKQTRRWI
jgi:protein-S-isoprenylcysteine O-methyltransferase Ste14